MCRVELEGVSEGVYQKSGGVSAGVYQRVHQRVSVGVSEREGRDSWPTLTLSSSSLVDAIPVL